MVPQIKTIFIIPIKSSKMADIHINLNSNVVVALQKIALAMLAPKGFARHFLYEC